MTRPEDPRPTPHAPARIAVVGGGCSGTLAAANLLRRATSAAEITLVERRAEVGRGVAYGTDDPHHLLNVPAGRMSAWPDEPDDLLDWLRAAADGGPAPMPDATPATFAPRRLYGAYLAATLDRARRTAAPGVELRVLHAEATGVRRGPDGLTFDLADGRTVDADRAVLALGHGPPVDPSGVGEALHDDPRYVRDPWARGALDGIRPDAPVLLLGTGLTAVDVVLTLASRGHTGPLVAMSRRGLLPHAHRAGHAADAPFPLPTDLSGLVAYHRAAPAEAWRAALDALRPYAPVLWQHLGPEEQRRFLRHLRPYWDVHRHRMAPGPAATVAGLLASGQLTVRAGRLLRAVPGRDGLDVDVRYRGQRTSQTLRVGALVNGTGTSLRYRPDEAPLFASLARGGWVRPHPLGLGFAIEPATGALLDGRGRPSDALFTLGPPRIGALWETTAVPEIRRQAADLAGVLLG